jgi:O-acetyl-ADP-ribose deacetylase (regulator of RNase III)
MKITYKFGDMFASFEMVLVHGCNKAGGFNSGVAGVMRKQYPDAYKGYMTAYHNQELELGHIVWVTAPDGRLIGNAITQEKYGRDPKIVYASYEGIHSQC